VGALHARRNSVAEQKQVVILVHGIRDFARWHSNVRIALEQAGLVVVPTNYGRMNLLEFLAPFPFFRKLAAEKVLVQIRYARKLHPGAIVSVIAHSFGTYVVSMLLKSEIDMPLHRVIFCGSVVRYDFPFEQLEGRFTPEVLNEVGTADPWPAVAEAVTTGYGSAGSFGFNTPGVRDRYHNDKSHDYFLTPEFATRYWVPFLRKGTYVEGDVPAKKPPAWVQLVSIFKVKYFVAGLAAAWILLKVIQTLAGGPVQSVTLNFGEPYGYWNDPVRILVASVKAPCNLTPGKLCDSPSVTRFVMGREYIGMGLEDPEVRKIVTCKEFEIDQADPNIALQQLANKFPSCISLERGAMGWALRLKAQGVTRVPRNPGQTDALLCGCTASEVTNFTQKLQEGKTP
jgi:hypothetical protein